VLGYIEKLPINTSSGIPLEKAHKPKNKTIVKAIKPSNSKDDLILKNSIVVISTRSGIGTGFYIYPEYILTNYHVTNGTPIVKISSKSGESTSGVVVAFDKELDLALIASPQLKGTQLHLLDSSAKVGEEVKAYGHPKGYTYSVSRGIVSSNRALPIGSGALNRTSKFVQSDVALSPGNSGGPLMQNGSVVGVATWKRIDADVEGLSFSVSSTEIIKWLRDYPQSSK
jgi:serine protease Do